MSTQARALSVNLSGCLITETLTGTMKNNENRVSIEHWQRLILFIRDRFCQLGTSKRRQLSCYRRPPADLSKSDECLKEKWCFLQLGTVQLEETSWYTTLKSVSSNWAPGFLGAQLAATPCITIIVVILISSLLLLCLILLLFS